MGSTPDPTWCRRARSARSRVVQGVEDVPILGGELPAGAFPCLRVHPLTARRQRDDVVPVDPVAPRPGEHRGDHLRIEHGLALGDAPQVVAEALAIGHTLLEQ